MMDDLKYDWVVSQENRLASEEYCLSEAEIAAEEEGYSSFTARYSPCNALQPVVDYNHGVHQIQEAHPLSKDSRFSSMWLLL